MTRGMRHPWWVLLTVLIVSAALLGAGCAPRQAEPGAGEEAAQWPLIVRDMAGRDVTISAEPKRIVSLAPSNTEIVFALGLGEKLVGVTALCNWPEEAADKPKVGDFRINREAVVALDPDLVLGISGHEELAEDLGQAGIPVLILAPTNLEEIYDSIILVGQATGAETEAQRLVDDMRAQVKEIRQTVADKATQRPKVFILLDIEGLWTAGPGTFLDELVRLAGGENVAAKGDQPYMQYSAEQLLLDDPDVILVTFAGADEFRQDSRWQSLKAVRAGRVIEVNADLVSRPGPRIVEGLREVAKALHPDIFK